MWPISKYFTHCDIILFFSPPPIVTHGLLMESVWAYSVSGPDLRGPAGPQASYQQRPSHRTVHILSLANDRCLRDYDLVVAHC